MIIIIIMLSHFILNYNAAFPILVKLDHCLINSLLNIKYQRAWIWLIDWLVGWSIDQSIPCPGEVGPVFHKLLAHSHFFLCVSKGSIQWHSEDKFYLIAVHDTHPFWPGIGGGAVVKQKEAGFASFFWIPKKRQASYLAILNLDEGI